PSTWPRCWTSTRRSNGSRNWMRGRRASWKCVSSAEWSSTRSPRRSTYLWPPPSEIGSFHGPGCMTPSLPDSDTPSGSRIARLEALFWAAVNTAPDEREKFLSVECPDDPELQHELQRMLAANERGGAFLEIPLPEVLASDLPRASVARWKLLECVGEGGL